MLFGRKRAALPACVLFVHFLGLLTATSHAGPINLIQDGGFESPVLTPGPVQTESLGPYTADQVLPIGTFGPWFVIGPPGIGFGPIVFQSTQAEEGRNFLDLTSGSFNNDSIEQLIPTALGQTYDVSFYVGQGGSGPDFVPPSTIGLRIDGGSDIAFSNFGVTPGGINWKFFSDTFTATGTATLLRFDDLNPHPSIAGQAFTANDFTGLDNVVVTAASTSAPEPASLFLALCGMAGCTIASRAARWGGRHQR